MAAPVSSATRNPAWNRDELILALELYRRGPAAYASKASPAILELSALLNQMHRLTSVSATDTLRNPNGVYLKLMNLRSLDPTYTAQGKVGMTSGGKLEKLLWNEFEGREAELRREAQLIRETIQTSDSLTTLPASVEEQYEGEEGGIILRLHRRYERDRRLIAEKRKAAANSGSLACEVCGFDFGLVYGELGTGYIEVHHTTPVHLLKPGSKTKLTDLALLCANCHRMAHRKRIPLTLDELRQQTRR